MTDTRTLKDPAPHEEAAPSCVEVRTRCPYCHADADALDGSSIACGVCLARHHSECWREGGSTCASCGARRALVPAPAMSDATLAFLLRQGRVEEAKAVLVDRGLSDAEARAFCDGAALVRANPGPRVVLGVTVLAVLSALATLLSALPHHGTVPRPWPVLLALFALVAGLGLVLNEVRAPKRPART